jgi:hypothetical protein
MLINTKEILCGDVKVGMTIIAYKQGPFWSKWHFPVPNEDERYRISKTYPNMTVRVTYTEQATPPEWGEVGY